GRLAIIGPISRNNVVPANLRDRALKAAMESPTLRAVVWIQPSMNRLDVISPVYMVQERGIVIAAIRSETVADLEQSPESQMNLLRVVQIALNSEVRLIANELK